MSREEAIANLNMISVAFVEPVTKEQRKLIDDTFDMAIQALENHDTFMKYAYSQGKHDALSQEPTEKPMCDRNICISNEYNGIGCDECIVNKVEQEPCDKCKYFDGNSCQHYDYKVGYTQGYEDANNRFRQEPCDKCVYSTKDGYCQYDDIAETIPTEQEPCDDAISRDMALKKMADYVASGYADSVEDFENYSRIICQLPSVTQKSGKWQVVSDGYGDGAYICECSECKDTVWVYKNADRKWNYCPNCGAKMVEPQERSE